MGYFSKFKNAAQDFGSFAVPAGVSFGLSALSGGTLNPGTLAILASLGAGAKGLQGNEQQERLRKMQLAQQKATEEAQAANKLSAGRASLINTLKPGAGARGTVTQAEQVQAPKAGLLETVAGGIGTGATVASQVMQAQNMLKDAAARRGLVEAQTGALDSATAAREAAKLQAQDLETGARQFGLKGALDQKQAGQQAQKLVSQLGAQRGAIEDMSGINRNVPDWMLTAQGQANRGPGMAQAAPMTKQALGGAASALPQAGAAAPADRFGAQSIMGSKTAPGRVYSPGDREIMNFDRFWPEQEPRGDVIGGRWIQNAAHPEGFEKGSAQIGVPSQQGGMIQGSGPATPPADLSQALGKPAGGGTGLAQLLGGGGPQGPAMPAGAMGSTQPSFLSKLGGLQQESIAPRNAAQQAGFEGARGAAAQERQGALDDALKRNQAGRMYALKLKKAQQDVAPAAVDARKTPGAMGIPVLLRTAPEMTFEQFAALPQAEGIIKAAGEDGARTLFQEAQQEVTSEFRDATNKVLFMNVGPLIAKDKLLGMAGFFQFAMGTAESGMAQNNGFGDIDMIVANVRMSDPTATVRSEDIKTQSQALAMINTLELFASGERIFGEGGRLTPTARKRLLESTRDKYLRNKQQIDVKLPGMRKMALGALDPNTPNVASRVDTFLDTYRLPGLDSFTRSGGAAAVDPAIEIQVELADIEAELARLRGETEPGLLGGLGTLGLGLGRSGG